MAGTKNDALRNSQADALVSNLDAIELKDTNGTVIATASGISWNSASGGTVAPSADITLTGNTMAGEGTDAESARIYDEDGTEEIDGFSVTSTTNGSGDIQLDNTNIAQNQTVTIPSENVDITEPTNTQ